MKLKRAGAGLFLLFSLLSIGTLLAQGLYHPGHSSAGVPPPDSNSTYTISAEMIDVNHIQVTANGTYSPDGNPNNAVDMSTVGGMYYDGQAIAGDGPPQKDFTQGGAGGIHVGVSDPKCISHIIIDSDYVNHFGGWPDMSYDAAKHNNQPLYLDAHFDLHIDPAGSTVDPNGCINLSIDRSPILFNPQIEFPSTVQVLIGDPAWTSNNQGTQGGGWGGGNRYGSTIGIGQGTNSGGGPGLITPQVQHSGDVAFFKADDNTILSTQGDPTYDNGGARTEFDADPNYNGGPRKFLMKNGGTCPDYILETDGGDPVDTTNSVQRVAYYVQNNTSNCGTNRAFYVLMLQNTPTNTASGVTNAQGGTESGNGGNTGPACPIDTWGLRWFACPLVTGVEDTIGKLTDTVQAWLVTDITNTFDYQHSTQAHDYHEAWNSFRVIAISFIVIAGLVMVISEALGVEAVSAYTVRRVLPRLITFAILIELSWVGEQFIAQFSNNMASWIGDIITFPFSNLLQHQVTLAGMLGEWLLALGAGLLLGIAGLLMLLASIALTIFGLFAVLLVRYTLLIATIIFLPVALAGMILPGTQRFARIVIDEYIAVQLIFPLIFAVGFALAQVARAVIGSLG